MNKPLLVIANKNYSSWSLRGWLMLRHAGLDFDEVRIPLAGADTRQRILVYSPSGKVPVLRDGDLVIWDSLAIGEYLYETCPALWPASRAARARARSISAEMHSGFLALRGAMPMNIRARGRRVSISGAVQEDIDRIKAVWRTQRAEYGRAGPWLFGTHCLADVMFAPVALRFLTYGVSEAGVVDDYIATVVSDPLLAPWLQAAATEAEVIEDYELGL